MDQSSTGSQAQTTTPVSTEVAQPTPATVVAKGEKKTEKILAILRALQPGETKTISEIQEALGCQTKDAKNVVQSTLSQMKQKGKVEKVRTLNRMPGYCLPKPKTSTPAV